MKNNTAIILLLLSVGLFYAFTNGQYQEVKKLYALTNEYKNVLKNVSDIVELRDRLRITYETFPKAELERINKVLPDHIDTVQLALDLDSMASRYGISIKSIKTEKGAATDADFVVLPENASVYEKATVSLSFISNYENFKRLLADIEKSLRIMNIKSVSFKTSETGLYDYEISAETYWLK
ncbi:MAG: type 4a pilus biogenesis protein PilO [bacterium]|nr:type 4a pilus biogenesis protein PilO [bacterium]